MSKTYITCSLFGLLARQRLDGKPWAHGRCVFVNAGYRKAGPVMSAGDRAERAFWADPIKIARAKKVLLLRDSGLTYAQIGTEMGVNASRVKVLLDKANKKRERLFELKLYIACSSQELFNVKFVADRLTAMGHSITHAWWEHFPELELSPEDKLDIAGANLLGVALCDILVFLPARISHGAALECGYALALGKPVLQIGDSYLDQIWEHLPTWTVVETIDDVPAALEMIG